MEITVNLRLNFLLVVIILSHNFNTLLKSNLRCQENGTSSMQTYELTKAPDLAMKPNCEHYQASVTEQHCYLWILKSVFIKSRFTPVMCRKQRKLHRISINETDRKASESIEKYNGLPLRRDLFRKQDLIAKLDKIHPNVKLKSLKSYIMEYILFCLFIVMVLVNNRKTLNSNLFKDEFGMVRFYFDRQQNLENETLKGTKKSIFEKLFDLRFQSLPKTIIVAYPSSFERYLQDIKNKTTNEDLMKNEWARYSSFGYFPICSNESPIRLAQAGFYYSGVGESVTCFSCGKKCDTWAEDETALEVHQRISPNCAFICGQETTHISIHDTSNQEMISSGNSNSSSAYKSSCEHQQNGATGGPDDINTNKTCLSLREDKHQEQKRQTDQLHVNKTPACEELSTIVNKATPSCSTTNTNATNSSSCKEGYYEKSSPLLQQNRERTTACEESPIVVRTSTPSVSGSTAMHNTGQPARPSRMSYDNAKHPEYAVKSVREASYAGWREHMSPVELSEAGFYYAGFQDCVRCFYCGGGLKNWDYGDSPWVEHARWYPSCDYLWQVKGGEFVQMYREDGGDDGQQGAPTNTNNVPEISKACCANEGNINMHHTLDVDMNSAAVESVLEMGYTRDTVENTVRKYRQMNGNQNMTAETLMNIILDSDQSQNTTNYPSTSVTNITTALNISTRDETAPQRHPATGEENNKTRKKDEKANASKKADLTSLVEENRSLREQMMCKICMDNDANIVFLPCGHLVACTECAPAIRKCAVCRKLIKGTVRAFPS